MNWGSSAQKFYLNVLNETPKELKDTATVYLAQYIKLKGPQRQYTKENIIQHLAKIRQEEFKRKNLSPKSPIVIDLSKPYKTTKEPQVKTQVGKQVEDRKKRFANEANLKMQQGDISDAPIVGLNMSIEKGYLRLTGPPNPLNCRPLPILKKALEMVKRKWKQFKDYTYLCDQLKSIRQDLSVQNIRNEFTISVYEYHGKIALEKMDIGEFNQCQTQLWELYHNGTTLTLDNCLNEFTAYRILYFIFTKRNSELILLFKALTKEQTVIHCIKHACEVRKAVDMNDCYEVLKLHRKCPNIGKNLMGLFIERVRTESLRAITRAFRKEITMDFIATMLGLSFEETFNFIDALIQSVSDDALDAVFVMGDVCAVHCTDLFPYVDERCNQLSKIDIKGQIY